MNILVRTCKASDCNNPIDKNNNDEFCSRNCSRRHRYNTDPEYRKREKERVLKRWHRLYHADSVFREKKLKKDRRYYSKNSEYWKQYYEENKDRLMEYGREYSHEYLNDTEKQELRLKHREEHPEITLKRSNVTKERWKDTKYRGKMNEALNSTGYKIKRSNIAKELWEDPEYREKISKANSGKNNPNYGKYGEMSANWRGGVSFEPYCSKFNNALKENIRNRDERNCQLCGKSEIFNGRRLPIHHIDGNKMQGCDDHDWHLISLCNSCNSKNPEDNPFLINLFMFMDLIHKNY